MSTTSLRATPGTGGAGSPWGSLVGAAADLGVLLPIVVVLVVRNGLSPTAVLMPVGALYLLAAVVYRVPVPVQPMKAMTALAIALALPPDVVAAGALTIGAAFVALGASGLLDRGAAVMPLAVVRGVQLAVGLALLEVAVDLVARPPAAFKDQASPWLVAAAASALVLVFARWPRAGLSLALLGAVASILAADEAPMHWGPASIQVPDLSVQSFAAALVLLVVPQVPLTVTSSCLATADALRQYYGPRASRVSSGRLALTLGVGNLVAGTVSGMPMCHGSGGVSAHYRFGARTWLAPAVAGAGLLVLGLALGDEFLHRAGAFPLPLLAALLATAGLTHVGLLRHLGRKRDHVIALAIGIGSTVTSLAPLVLVAVALWWALPALRGGPTMRRLAEGEQASRRTQPQTASTTASVNE